MRPVPGREPRKSHTAFRHPRSAGRVPGAGAWPELLGGGAGDAGYRGLGSVLQALILPPALGGGGCRECLVSAPGPGSLRFPALFSKEAGLRGQRGSGVRGQASNDSHSSGRWEGSWERDRGPACLAGWPSQLTFVAKELLFPEPALSHSSSAEAAGGAGRPAGLLPPMSLVSGLEKEWPGGGLSSSLHTDLRGNRTRGTVLQGGTLSREGREAPGCREMGQTPHPGTGPRGDLHLLAPETVGSAQSRSTHLPETPTCHSITCSLHPSRPGFWN